MANPESACDMGTSPTLEIVTRLISRPIISDGMLFCSRVISTTPM